jgi:hypothetical protein
MRMGFWERMSLLFEGLRLTWIRSPWIQGTVGQLWIGQNTTQSMYVSGLALISWTYTVKKKWDEKYAWDNVSQMKAFMFAWDAVLQWTLYSWVSKYSGPYMWVEVSLGQYVHGCYNTFIVERR